MASVIGILFFVVILVSLDIVEQEETLAGRVAGEPATEKITQLRAAIPVSYTHLRAHET